MINKKNLMEEKLENIIGRILKEESGRVNISIDRDELYALIKLVGYAINKRIGESVTGLDYTRMTNLNNSLKNQYKN